MLKALSVQSSMAYSSFASVCIIILYGASLLSLITFTDGQKDLSLHIIISPNFDIHAKRTGNLAAYYMRDNYKKNSIGRSRRIYSVTQS